MLLMLCDPLGHYLVTGSHPKNPRSDYLALEGLDGYLVQGRILNLGGRKDGRINMSIDVIRVINDIRIYCSLLRVDHRP